MSLDEAYREGEWMVQKARERGGSSGTPTSRDITSTAAMAWTRTAGIESAKEQYRNNTDCAYSAIRPIANRIAMSPIRLGKMSDDELVNEDVEEGLRTHHRIGWRKNLAVYADGWACGTADRKGRHLKDATSALELVHSHSFLKALEQPSMYVSRFHLMFSTVASLQATGRSYWLIVDSKRPGFKYDIWCIPSHWLEPDNTTGFHNRWKMRIDGTGDEWFVPAERVAYFFYPDPGDPFGASSPMHAASKSILADQSIKTAWKAGFDNGMTPDLVVTIGEVAGPDGKKLTRPQLESWQANQIESRLNQLYRGPEKHRRVVLLDAIVSDVKPLSNTPDEMDFQESADTISKSIYQTFGVNRVITGENDNTNRAAALVADSTFCDNIVNPLIEMMTQVINNSVLPLFDSREEVVAWVERLEKQDPELELKRMDLGVRSSAVTQNEIRAFLNFPPLPDGNAIIVPLSNMLVPVNTDRKAEPTGKVIGAKVDMVLVQILQSVGKGEMSAEAAVQLAMLIVPDLSEEQARKIFDQGDEGMAGAVALLPKPPDDDDASKALARIANNEAYPMRDRLAAAGVLAKLDALSVKKKTHPDG